MSSKLSRRSFFKAMGAAAAGLSLAGCDQLLDARPETSAGDSPVSGNMPMRALGNTGASVSLLGLGGQFGVESDNEARAIGIVERALERGVTYIDTARRYGGWPEGGRSERNIGKAIKGKRRSVFLATKSREDTYDDVMKDFENSLEALQTDYVDLYQVHNIGTADDVTALFQRQGGRSAIDAFARIRDEGAARFIGIAGHHDPEQLLAVLNHPDAPSFDAVLMALNAADHHRRQFQGELLPLCIERGIGVIAMKVMGGFRRILDDITTTEALHYVYSLPISTAIVGVTNASEVSRNANTTEDFKDLGGPLSAEQMQAIEDQTRATPDDPDDPDYERRGDWFKVERY